MGKEKLGVPAALLERSPVGIGEGNSGSSTRDRKTPKRRKKNRISRASRRRNK